MQASEHYRAQRLAATELYRSLDDQQLATAVPGCPLWTVRDLASHLAGLPASVNRGEMEGAGSPPWTGKQVADRAGQSVADVLQEWEQEAPPFEAALDGAGGLTWPSVMDVSLHLDDAREALGLPLGVTAADERVLDLLVAQAGRGAEGVGSLTIRSGDKQWTIGSGHPSAELRVDDRGELSRALGGRRTDDQVRALDWTGGPEPWLPVLPLFREGR